MLAAQQPRFASRPAALRCEKRQKPACCRPAVAALHGARSHVLGAQPAARQPVAHALSASRPSRAKPFSRRSFRVCAGWGDPIEWAAAKVVESRPAAEGLQRLTVDTGSIADGYKIPGQFVQVRVGESKPGFFAIASPPDANNQGLVELLVKPVPDTASQLIADTKAGDSVDVSPVMGKGFGVAGLPPADYPTLLLFATGTGIAPIRALLESADLQASDRKDVRLYYGTRSEATTAFQEEAAEWAALGVQLINVYSSADKGYVQDVFAREGGLADGAATGAVLCGQKQMCEQVTQILLERGVAADKILLNF